MILISNIAVFQLPFSQEPVRASDGLEQYLRLYIVCVHPGLSRKRDGKDWYTFARY